MKILVFINKNLLNLIVYLSIYNNFNFTGIFYYVWNMFKNWHVYSAMANLFYLPAPAVEETGFWRRW